MNPNNEVHRSRLNKAIKHHYKQLEDSRKLRRDLIADHAGSLYGPGTAGEKRKVVLSLMHQYAEALQLVLAANNPRFMVTPRHSSLRGFARFYQEAMNRLVVEIRLQEALQQVALDAFFGPAFIKTYLADAPLVQIEQDVWMDPGQPFASRISPEDHVYDTDVKDYRHVSFACDRYPVPLDLLLDDDTRFDPVAVAEILKQRQGRDMPERNVSERDQLARGLSHTNRNYWGEGDFEPRIDLVDVWLPAFGLTATWATAPEFDILNTTPLSVQEWDGPEEGMYRMLNLGPVPDNVLPSSPAMHVKFLFDLVNRIYRKLANQATRAKQLLLFEKGDEDDADLIRKEPDGGTVGLMNADAANVAQIGNVDNNLLAMGIHALQQFDQAAGNLSARAGLGASSPTATQDRLIQAQVSRQESATQARMLDFTAKVGRDLGYLLFTDPVKTLPVSDRVRGTDFEFTQRWRPGDREGEPDDYDFAVEPFSMAYRSPQERLQNIQGQLQAAAPFLPMMQQQGISIDWWTYWDRVAELSGEPDLRYMLRYQGQPIEDDEPQGESHDVRQSAVTSREQIRRSESGGGTQQGQDQQMMQALMRQPSNVEAA